MEKSLASVVWLHGLGATEERWRSDVATALEKAGVCTAPLDPDAPSRLGILFCSQLSDRACEFVRVYTRNGVARVLALTTSEAMSKGAAWQILAAGASDVLALDEVGDPAGMIAARLRRWQAVDELVASPLVCSNLVGRSGRWMAILRQVVEVARFTEASVLLVGETGTGKELVARLIHALSPQRRRKDLVVLDCTTIVPELSGSELFGHERGAFTGAVASRDGAFALADGGTLFLDEVGELPLGLQAQLLRVVQERTYKRVGSNVWRDTDFRLVCASNRDLLEEEARGRFRRDLYYRIASWVFRLPPLRERPEDILPLARHFVQEFHPDGDPLDLDLPVQEYLCTREYPGNVRDLRNLMQRIVHRHVGGGPITIGDIPADERPPVLASQESWLVPSFEEAVRRAILGGAGLQEMRCAVEELAVDIAIDQQGGNLPRAALLLGVTARTLQMRCAKKRQRLQTIADGG